MADRSASVVRMEAAHASAVTEFLVKVWDPTATPEQLLQARAAAAALNPVNPGEPPPTFLFLRSGHVVGYVTTFPFLLWHGGAARQAHWLNGLMVLPEFRNGPIGFLLLKEAVSHLPCAMALSVAPPARRLFEAMGFADVGTLGNAVRVIRPQSFLRKLDLTALGIGGLPAWFPRVFATARRAGLTPLMGGVMSAADAVYVRARRDVGARLNAQIVDSVEELDVTRLWEEARVGFGASPVRDTATWRTRYGGRREGRALYRFVRVDDGRQLRAIAVVRRPNPKGDERLKGIAVATISDLLWRPGDDVAVLRALRAVDVLARDLGAEAVLCTASMSALTSLLRRAGFAPVGGNLHLLVREQGPQRSLPSSLAAWHLTRGDAHVDEVF